MHARAGAADRRPGGLLTCSIRPGHGGPSRSAPGIPLPRPFEGIYGVSLLTAILALVPYIIVTSAYTLLRKRVSHDIAAGTTALEIINGLATAGYAFGALLGGDLINRFKQRRLFLLCEALFIASCALSGTAGGSTSPPSLSVSPRRHCPSGLSVSSQMCHTLPVIGTLAAMIGGAAFFTLMILAQQFCCRSSMPRCCRAARPSGRRSSA